jgi:hypothetical protein
MSEIIQILEMLDSRQIELFKIRGGHLTNNEKIVITAKRREVAKIRREILANFNCEGYDGGSKVLTYEEIKPFKK